MKVINPAAGRGAEVTHPVEHDYIIAKTVHRSPSHPPQAGPDLGVAQALVGRLLAEPKQRAVAGSGRVARLVPRLR